MRISWNCLRQRRQGAEWGSEPEPARADPAAEGNDPDLERFTARLEEIAARFNLELPAAARSKTADLEAFQQFLDAASARLALAA